MFSGEKSGPVLVRQVKAPAEAEGQAIDPFYLQIEDIPATEFLPAGVRVTHKPANEQQAEQREQRTEASEAREAAKIAKVEAAVPEMALKLWTKLRQAQARTVTNREMLEALVVGTGTIKSAAATKLLTEGRIILVKGQGKGEGKWYEAV